MAQKDTLAECKTVKGNSLEQEQGVTRLNLTRRYRIQSHCLEAAHGSAPPRGQRRVEEAS